MNLVLIKCAKFRVQEFHRLNDFSNSLILKGPKLLQIPEANSRGSKYRGVSKNGIRWQVSLTFAVSRILITFQFLGHDRQRLLQMVLRQNFERKNSSENLRQTLHCVVRDRGKHFKTFFNLYLQARTNFDYTYQQAINLLNCDDDLVEVREKQAQLQSEMPESNSGWNIDIPMNFAG